MSLEKAPKLETGWTELFAPELIKWDAPGSQVTGILTAVTQIKIQGKQVTQYALQSGEQSLKFLGTYDITQKLTAAHRGCKVRIKYLGEDDTVRGGANNTPMKVFSVQIQGTPSPNMHGVTITDEDVPF